MSESLNSSSTHAEPGVWIAAALILIGVLASSWDLYCWAKPGSLRTVSEVLNSWGEQWPPSLIALGFVLGHLFWPLHRK